MTSKLILTCAVSAVLLSCALAALQPASAPQDHAAVPSTGPHAPPLPVGEWQAAAPDACRGPCPMINTLANHGYLPRDGKNINKTHLIDVLHNHAGLSQKLAEGFAMIVFKNFGKTGTFDLCQIQKSMKEGGVEHDASMSRSDRNLADKDASKTQRNPDPKQIAKVLKCANPAKMLTLKEMVPCREAIWKDTFAANKEAEKDVPLVLKAKIVAAVETIFLLEVLGGAKAASTHGISTADTESFLKDEKFPQDWKPAKFGIPQLIKSIVEYGALATVDSLKNFKNAAELLIKSKGDSFFEMIFTGKSG